MAQQRLRAACGACPGREGAPVSHDAAGNKIDVGAREVSVEEATEFARKQAMMYIEASAKTNTKIQQAFEEVVQKILDTPKLLEEAGYGLGGLSGAGMRLDSDSASASYCSYC